MTGQLSSVLFVCLGNICRSPTAEAVFKHKVEENGLNIQVDSAGTKVITRVLNQIKDHKQWVKFADIALQD